jgi:hypothetical protein
VRPYTASVGTWQVRDREGSDWQVALHRFPVSVPATGDDSTVESLDRAVAANLEHLAIPAAAAVLVVRSIRSHFPSGPDAAWIVTATALSADRSFFWTANSRSALDEVISAIEHGALPGEILIEGHLPTDAHGGL